MTSSEPAHTSDTPYWIAFSLLPEIGPRRLRRVADYFASMEEAWSAPVGALIAAGLEVRVANAAAGARASIDVAAQAEKAARAGAMVLTLRDPAYPARLAEIYDAPPVLYVRGALTPEDEWSVAVVGTRNITPYGREATHQLCTALARRGVDAVAHRAALAAGGRTIAVFACGVDVIYPLENSQLAADIREAGALISEHPVGSKPDAPNFPARNRIISGTSLGTVVIEAGEKSGALITAARALEQNREVFAVPGSIFGPRSVGTNRLIRDSGAKLVLSVEDVLDELQVRSAPQQLEMRLLLPTNEVESTLLALLGPEPLHVDALIRASNLAASEVSSALVMMELSTTVVVMVF